MVQERVPHTHYRREWVASKTVLDSPTNVTEFARKTNSICPYYEYS
jgi:hypothetical protein